MTKQVTIELPVEVFSAMRRGPEELARDMRLAAAAKWYEAGMLSQSRSAEVAGLSRADFLAELARFKVTPFQTTVEELEEEFRRG
jgi:predicted HTH domain antitoxin